MTNTSVEFAKEHLLIHPPHGGDLVRIPYDRGYRNHSTPDRDWLRIGGRRIWGAIDSYVYNIVIIPPAPISLPTVPLNADGLVYSVDAHVAIDAASRDERFSDAMAISNELWTFGQQHGFRITPLDDFLNAHRPALAENWNLWFDVIYTSLNSDTAVAVRNGRMMIWDLEGTGHPMGEWTARNPFPTAIDGPFRIMRAGENLERMFFIDESGGIHTGIGADHHRVGGVVNFSHENPDTLTLIFEDQKTQRIGFFHAAPDHTMTVLDIEWIDNSFADDFITEIESDELRTNLNRMADALREDRQRE